MLMRGEPASEEIAAYFGLEPEQVAQIVLLLLIQEGVQQRLSALLSGIEQLPVKPAA
jgi:hypothetical protein